MQALRFKVGDKVKYKPKSFIQTVPERYKSLTVARYAIRDYDISDFVITDVYSCLVDGDERSRIVHIVSKEHREDYNTLVIFLSPPTITTIMEGDRL